MLVPKVSAFSNGCTKEHRQFCTQSDGWRQTILRRLLNAVVPTSQQMVSHTYNSGIGRLTKKFCDNPI